MKKYTMWLFLIGSLAMMVIMSKSGGVLSKVTRWGILDLEFAYSKAKADAVLNAWTAAGPDDTIAAAKLNTGLDFIFLFCYSIFLFLAASRISRIFGGGFGKAGKFIARGALAAGVLDVLENGGMLLSLSGHGSNIIAFCTSFCSVIKWALALLAVLYILTGAVGWLRSRLLK